MIAGLCDAAAVVDRVFSQHLTFPPHLTVAEWADRNRTLPRKTSSEPGPWRTDRTPYLRQILDDLSEDSGFETVALQFGTQLGKSECGLNWNGYTIDHAPGPMMTIQPTVDLAKRYSRQRVSAMIESTPALRSRIKDSRSRDSGNTVQLKEFSGGIWVLTGANSAAGLASMPARYMHADEIDDYPLDVDGQGDPIQIATARQDTFSRRKNLFTSSPKRPKGFSAIESLRLAGTDFRYQVPCPDCGRYQELVWADEPGDPGLKFRDNDPETATYVCAGCGVEIAEHHKGRMLAAGIWVPMNPGRLVRSYLLSSLYSPLGWCSWKKIVKEHLGAIQRRDQGDIGPYKAWVNTRLAKTYAETGARISEDWLRKRVGSLAAGTVAEGCYVLTAGVDVQDNRLEVGVWGWGPGDEGCVVGHFVIWGDPARTQRLPDGQPTVWERLDDLLRTRFEHALDKSASLPVEAVGVDTGGHCTHAVYNYCRARSAMVVSDAGRTWVRRTYAIKGEDRKPGTPIKGKASNQDVNWEGQIVKAGVKLWKVGTNSAKDWLHAHLRMEVPGAGFIHIPTGLPDEWFGQMTAEQRMMVRTSAGHRMVWVCENGKRNEALDCAVYALFSAHALDLNRYTSASWDRLRDRIVPKQVSLFEAPARAVAPEAPAEGAVASPERRRSADQRPARPGWLKPRGQKWL